MDMNGGGVGGGMFPVPGLPPTKLIGWATVGSGLFSILQMNPFNMSQNNEKSKRGTGYQYCTDFRG